MGGAGEQLSILSLLVLIFLLPAPAALADRPGVEKADLKRAEALAAAAFELHTQGESARAAQLFLEAYALSDLAPPLRNAAKCFEAANMIGEAIDAWERYAARVDVAADKKLEAKVHVDALVAKRPPAKVEPKEEAIAAPAREPPKIAPQIAPRLEPVGKKQDAPVPVLGWVLVGGGGLAVIGGGVLYASSWTTYSRYRDSMDDVQEISRDDASNAKVRAGAGVVIGAIGACLITGALLFAFDE